MADLNLALLAYFATLRAAATPAANDITTAMAQDLKAIRDAHVAEPLDLDDANTLYRIHLNG